MKLTLIKKSLILIGLVSILGILAINEAHAALEQQYSFNSPSSERSRFNNPKSGAEYTLVQHTTCAQQHMIDIGYDQQHCITPKEYNERQQANGVTGAPKPSEPFDFSDSLKPNENLPKQYLDDNNNPVTLTPY